MPNPGTKGGRRPGTSLPSPGDIKQTPRGHSPFVSPAGHPRFDLRPSTADGKNSRRGFWIGSLPFSSGRGVAGKAAGTPLAAVRIPKSPAHPFEAPLKWIRRVAFSPLPFFLKAFKSFLHLRVKVSRMAGEPQLKAWKHPKFKPKLYRRFPRSQPSKPPSPALLSAQDFSPNPPLLPKFWPR